MNHLTSVLFSWFVLFLLLVGSNMAVAQITIAPTRVVISGRENDAEVTISNPTGDPLEVTAQFGFAIFRSDSMGHLFFDAPRTEAEREVSCDKWLKLFPKRFVLPPGESRSVRVLATFPEGLADGEYWARLRFLGNRMEPAKPADPNDTNVRAKIDIKLSIEVPVMVRKGLVQTGMSFEGISTRRDSTTTKLLVDMKRQGNSAYRGTIFGKLRRPDGSEIELPESSFTMEFAIRQVIPLPALSDGTYSLVLEARSVRKGSAAEVTLPAPTVTQQFELVVQGNNARVTSLR